jgi:hypothetical protein
MINTAVPCMTGVCCQGEGEHPNYVSTAKAGLRMIAKACQPGGELFYYLLILLVIFSLYPPSILEV